MFTWYKMLHLYFNQKENMQLSFKEKKYIWKGEGEQCTLIKLNLILKNTFLLDEEYVTVGLSFLSFVLFFSFAIILPLIIFLSHCLSAPNTHRRCIIGKEDMDIPRAFAKIPSKSSLHLYWMLGLLFHKSTCST